MKENINLYNFWRDAEWDGQKLIKDGKGFDEFYEFMLTKKRELLRHASDQEDNKIFIKHRKKDIDDLENDESDFKRSMQAFFVFWQREAVETVLCGDDEYNFYPPE